MRGREKKVFRGKTEEAIEKEVERERERERCSSTREPFSCKWSTSSENSPLEASLSLSPSLPLFLSFFFSLLLFLSLILTPPPHPPPPDAICPPWYSDALPDGSVSVSPQRQALPPLASPHHAYLMATLVQRTNDFYF